MSGEIETFAGSDVPSVVPVLRPRGPGWEEREISQRYSMGYPIRAFVHTSGLTVLSAVEVVIDENKSPEYHVSISKQVAGRPPSRCDSNEAKWVLDQFGLDGAEGDNHVESGIVRNFWRTVADPLVGIECACKADEPAIREDKGDFVWRPIGK